MAVFLGIGQARVSKLERASSPPSDLNRLREWAERLIIPPQLLWFKVNYALEESRSATSQGSLEAMQRRSFLKAASLTATTLGTSFLPEPISDSATGTASPNESSDVSVIRGMTAAFRHADNKHGGGHRAIRITIDSFLKSNVQPLLHRNASRANEDFELYRAAAEMYQAAAWIAYDTGNSPQGRRHLREAVQLSDRANDESLVAEMFAAMSHQEAFSGSAESAIDLALSAHQSAKRTGISALCSETSVMQAHGYALLGERRNSLAALTEAERVFGSYSSSQTPAWLSYFDESYLAAKFAHTFRELGQLDDAELYARRSLAMNEGYDRGRLFNTALLASILADKRQPEEACTLGIKALDMTQRVRSVRTVAYLADLGNRLSPFRSTLQVQAVYEKMEQAGISTPESQ